MCDRLRVFDLRRPFQLVPMQPAARTPGYRVPHDYRPDGSYGPIEPHGLGHQLVVGPHRAPPGPVGPPVAPAGPDPRPWGSKPKAPPLKYANTTKKDSRPKAPPAKLGNAEALPPPPPPPVRPPPHPPPHHPRGGASGATEGAAGVALPGPGEGADGAFVIDVVVPPVGPPNRCLQPFKLHLWFTYQMWMHLHGDSDEAKVTWDATWAVLITAVPWSLWHQPTKTGRAIKCTVYTPWQCSKARMLDQGKHLFTRFWLSFADWKGVCEQQRWDKEAGISQWIIMWDYLRGFPKDESPLWVDADEDRNNDAIEFGVCEND